MTIEKIRKVLKWIGYAFAALLAIFAGVKIARWVGSLGKDDEPVGWSKIPGEKDKIMIETEPGEWETVKLPDGVKADEIKMAGRSKKTGEVKVEILHNTVDRRNADGVSDSAGDRIRKNERRRGSELD